MTAPPLLIVNPNTDTRITAFLRQEAERILAGRATLEAINVESGFAALQTPEQVEAAGRNVVTTLIARQPQAAVIAAFGDPGLAQARALGFRVAGLGESGLRAAAAGPFAILTLGAAMQDAIAARVEHLGLTAKLTQIRTLPHAISDFVPQRDALTPEIAAEIGSLARDGANCVLLGGAPFAGLAHRLGTKETRVLDGVESALAALGLRAPHTG